MLFGLSWDYVGDISETMALMWPAPARRSPTRAEPSSEVVEALATLGKAELPGRLARWLDALDETGRWAFLKLVTGALRVGVSARLAKTAVAALGDKTPTRSSSSAGAAAALCGAVRLARGPRREAANHDPAPFRPAMLAHAIEETDFAALDPAAYPAEWKWDGIRVQAAAGPRATAAAADSSRGPARTCRGASPTWSRRCDSTAPSTANC